MLCSSKLEGGAVFGRSMVMYIHIRMDRVFIVAFDTTSPLRPFGSTTTSSNSEEIRAWDGFRRPLLSTERVLDCSFKAAKKRRFFPFQIHRTWLSSGLHDLNQRWRDLQRIAINFSGCISCVCLSPPCVCPSMYLSLLHVYLGVCMSRRATVCISLPCVCPERVHVPLCVCPLSVYVPPILFSLVYMLLRVYVPAVYVLPCVRSSVCMPSPCVCPSCVSPSVCMFLRMYILSVRMSPPCMSRCVHAPPYVCPPYVCSSVSMSQPCICPNV